MLKRYTAAAIATTLLALSGLTGAQANPSATSVKGGLCYGTPQALQCEYLGKVTVKEIYDKGWRVVAYVKEGPNSVTVVIEEQR